jgi:hypothetical protein
MRNNKILLVDKTSESFQEMGWVLDSTPEARKSKPDENPLHLLKMMSNDIRGSLVSILATLKLLNRGYYGKMDEGVANKLKEIFPQLVHLIAATETLVAALKETHSFYEEI